MKVHLFIVSLLFCFSANAQTWKDLDFNANQPGLDLGDYFNNRTEVALNALSEQLHYANADYRMHCIPTCQSATNPPKYPPFSYLESQANVQGE